VPVALAGGAGCAAGGWLWHDSSADLDEVSRRVYTCCGAGDRVGGDDPSEGDGTK